MTDDTATERQARYKDRQRAAGLRQITVWVNDEQAAAIRRYLNGTAPLPVTLPGTDAVTRHVTSNVTSHDPNKAALVKRAWELRQAGMTFQGICDVFTAEGTPTMTGRGIWRPGVVRKLFVQAGYLQPNC